MLFYFTLSRIFNKYMPLFSNYRQDHFKKGYASYKNPCKGYISISPENGYQVLDAEPTIVILLSYASYI